MLLMSSCLPSLISLKTVMVRCCDTSNLLSYDNTLKRKTEILTLDLKRSNANEMVSGKLVIAISTHGIGADGTEAPFAVISPAPTAFLAPATSGTTAVGASIERPASRASVNGDLPIKRLTSSPRPSFEHVGGSASGSSSSAMPANQPQRPASRASTSSASANLTPFEDALGPLPAG